MREIPSLPQEGKVINEETPLGKLIHVDFNEDRLSLGRLAAQENVPFEGGAGVLRGFFIANIIIQLNAQLVYETGFNIGGTAAPAAQALEYTGGKFVGFEINRSVESVASEFLKMYPHAEIVWGDSVVTLEQRWQETKEQPDFFFVDGSHSEEGCARDFNHALKIVRPGGIIMVDDVSNPPVSNIIHKLIPDVGSMWFEGEHQGTGVVIYQKPR